MWIEGNNIKTFSLATGAQTLVPGAGVAIGRFTFCTTTQVPYRIVRCTAHLLDPLRSVALARDSSHTPNIGPIPSAPGHTPCIRQKTRCIWRA